MAVAASSSNVLYLGINSNNYLYRKATKEEQDAYKNGSSDGSVALLKSKQGADLWHYQYSATDYGYVTKVEVADQSFDGISTEIFKLTLKTEHGLEVIQLPFKSTQGSINLFVKNIIMLLPEIDTTVKYSISPSRRTSVFNGKTYKDRNLYFNYMDGDSRTFLRSKLTFISDKNPNGDVPRTVKISKLGKEQTDSSEQDAYLFNILEHEIKRINGSSSEYSNSSDSNKSNKEGVTNNEPKHTQGSHSELDNNDDYDDLPF